MAGYRPYPEYKDSGVEWLGEVPNSWACKRLKFLVSSPLKYGANEAAELTDTDFPRYIRITDVNEDGTLKEETFRSLPPEVAEDYLLEDGDILLARSGATVGKTFIYKHSWGVAAYAGYLIRARMSGEMDADFAYYFLQSNLYWQWLNSIFIQATIQNVSAEKYANLWLTAPSEKEQQTITRFLDHKTAQIDALIAKKEALLEKLTEKRTALISHAVTKGLNPQAKMKDSGVEWLGQVPTHWDCGVKLNYLALPGRNTFVNGPFGSDLLSSELRDDGVPVIYSGDVKPSRFLRKSSKYVSEEKAEQLDFCRVDPGDLLLAKVGDPPGDAAIYPFGAEPGIVTQDVVRIKVDEKWADKVYLSHLLNSAIGRFVVSSVSVEATRSRFSLGDFKALRFVLPPIEEQESIAQAVDKMLEPLFLQERKVFAAIEKLKEYRSALITQAVTGKIDVRRYEVSSKAC